MSKKREGQEEESKFAFICYNKPGDKEYGPKCAFEAVT
jgi:RNA recognition motif-containing protein